MERTKRYPECFPGNFETEILPKGTDPAEKEIGMEQAGDLFDFM